jgi:hypothetical protein
MEGNTPLRIVLGLKAIVVVKWDGIDEKLEKAMLKHYLILIENLSKKYILDINSLKNDLKAQGLLS